MGWHDKEIHGRHVQADMSILRVNRKGGDKLNVDMGDPETRLLALSTIGWLLVGALAAILIRKKGNRKGGDHA